MIPITTESLKNRVLIHAKLQDEKDNHLAIDQTNIKIISALVNNPSMKSKQIAELISIPLSTIQRRRSILERQVLTKRYSIDIRELGWRTAELLVAVEKGNSDRIAEALLGHDNVISTSIRVGHPEVNVAARVFYRNSEQLHKLLEETKAMPFVESVEWSEIVKDYEKGESSMLNIVFG